MELLIVLIVCIVVLMSISLSALNKAVTGEGSPVDGTVRSFEDKLQLNAIMTGMITYAGEHNNWFPVPSDVAASTDQGLNTTANFWSLMIALQYVRPEHLISGNLQSRSLVAFALGRPPLAGRVRIELRKLAAERSRRLRLHGERRQCG